MVKPGFKLRSRDEIVSRFHRKERQRSAKAYKRFLARECRHFSSLRDVLPQVRDYLDSVEYDVCVRAFRLFEERGWVSRRELRSVVRRVDEVLRRELTRRIESVVSGSRRNRSSEW